MDILEKLREQGWYLTEEAIKKLPEDVDKSDPKKIIQAVMDMDLRGIGEGALPSDISKKENSICGNRVLQINKIRNISAPKSNEESKVAPRFLQLELTDGLNQIYGLEFDNISSISLNTPPGTKLYLKSDRIQLIQGQLILNSNDIQILGGKVQNLIDKWEMARQLQKYSKNCLNRVVINGTSSGPPPWIPFGQKIQQNIVGGNDKNFKSLGGGGGTNTNGQNGDGKENKEKNEFDTMRNEAIAEAAKAGAKKVFGGGNQQLLDYNVKKIMEKGYTEIEARNALKANRNSLEQALYNLKKRSEEYKNKESTLGGSSGAGGGGGKRIGFKDTGKRSKNDELPIQTKPAANVSLFDFLTDKLPASATTVTNQDSGSKNVPNKSERSKPFNHHDSVASKSTSYHHSQQQHQHQQSSYNRQHQSSSSNTSHYQISSTSSNQQQQKKDQQQQQPSQQQSQYQQNHANYNQTNRSKFENNLSSSFANRNTIPGSASEQQQHDSYKNRDISRQKESSSDKFKSNQRSNSSNYGQNQRPNDRYSSNYQKSGISSQPQSHQQQDHQQQQQQSQNQYQAKTSNISSYDPRNRNDYQKRNGYDNTATKMSSSSTNNPSRYHHSKDTSHPHAHSHQTNPRNYNESRQQQSNNTYDSGKMVNKLIEDTSKIKIDSISSTSSSSCIQQQQHQSHQQQQNSRSQSNISVVPHHQQQQQQHKSYQHHQQQQPSVPQQQTSHMQQRLPPHSQHQQMQAQPQLQSQSQHHSVAPHTATYAQTLPNGFTCDPNKIMGFQSKEANEFAMTLLKNQAAIAGNTAIQPTPIPMASHHASYPAPPPTIQIPPTAFTTPQFIMQPGPAGHPSIAAAPYGIGQCGTAGSGENWNWKIGDRCLAKYWDDGRYYDAEVTAVSVNTCVVLYLGYGNHEEVLKSDCLPITDAQHRPLMNMTKLLHESQLQPPSAPTGLATNPLAATAVPQPSIAAQAATIVPPPGTIPAGVVSQHAAALNTKGLHASRYRGERQMYVPPPKRDN